MTDIAYNRLKWVTLTGLPALTTFWLAIAGIWNLPLAVPIGATLAAIDLFIGSVLNKVSSDYAKTQKPK